MKQSKFLTLNERDVIKGFLIAVLTASLTALYNFLTTGTIITKEALTSIAVAGLASGVAYILKQLGTNSSNNIGPDSI